MLKTITNSINASQIQTPITLPGNVTLSTGNLVIGTSGQGIDFSITSHPAGMTSELLSDYEEGTWTPGIGTLTQVGGTYSSSGTYTKIGRSVTVIGRIDIAGGTISGAAASNITDLPFTVAAPSSIGSGIDSALTATFAVDAEATTTAIYFTAFAATAGIKFTVTYFT